MNYYHGTNVRGTTHLRDAFEKAGLNWFVETAPLKMTRADGSEQPLKRFLATYRSDTGHALGVVSNGYRVFQNEEVFDWVQALCDEGQFKLSHAAEYHGGRKIAITAELPTNTVVGGNDHIRRYLVAVNNHDGGGSVRMFPTTERAVCNNLLQLIELKASKSKTLFRMVHREGSLSDRVERGRAFLKSITAMHEDFQRVASSLNQREVTEQELYAYFKTLCAMKASSEKSAERMFDKLNVTFENDKNAGMMGPTAWAALNAVTEYSDHQGRKKSGESRLESNLF